MTNGDHIHASANTMPMREPQTGAVARYDGFVAKFMGDGVLSYLVFRAPMRRTLSGQSEPIRLRFAASGVGTSERI